MGGSLLSQIHSISLDQGPDLDYPSIANSGIICLKPLFYCTLHENLSFRYYEVDGLLPPQIHSISLDQDPDLDYPSSSNNGIIVWRFILLASLYISLDPTSSHCQMPQTLPWKHLFVLFRVPLPQHWQFFNLGHYFSYISALLKWLCFLWPHILPSPTFYLGSY